MGNLPSEPEFNPFAAPAIAPTANGALPELRLKQYATVRLGLQLIHYAVTAIATVIVLVFLFSFMGPVVSRYLPRQVFMTVAVLFPLGILAAIIVSLVGFCLCTACPNPNEKWLARTMIVCTLICFGASICEIYFGSRYPDPNYVTENRVPLLIACLAIIAAMFMFCFLLKQIGMNISSEAMQKNAHITLVWFGLLIAVSIGIILASATEIAPRFNWPSLVFGLILLTVALTLGTLFQFLSLVRNGIHELRPQPYA